MRSALVLVALLVLASCAALEIPQRPQVEPAGTPVPDTIVDDTGPVAPQATPLPTDVRFTWSVFGREFTLERRLDASIAREQDRKEQQAQSGARTRFEAQRAYALRRIEEPSQQREIANLTRELERVGAALNLTGDDIARLAVAFVQQIPYDDARLEMAIAGEPLPPSKYPYQVLLNNTGVCDEKSFLLAAMLTTLGYNTSIFIFDTEPIGHAAVGIACDDRFGYQGTGYCFIETTRPTIITYAESNYSNIGRLDVAPIVIPVGGTARFDASRDYADSAQYDELDGEEYRSYQKRLALISQYGLGEISCGPGSYLCDGQCWSGCADPGAWFHCTISGGLCYPPAQYAGDCPYGTNSCGKRCYETCGTWRFVCTPEGGICRDGTRTTAPKAVLEYDDLGRPRTPIA